MKKDTAKLMEELKSFSDFNSFFEENKEQVAEVSVCDYLSGLIAEKGLNKADVIKNAELSETYAYQIFSGIKKAPSRSKLLSLSFGMGLSLEETQEMLKKTGYAPLYAKIPYDSIIIYGLYKRLSVLQVNELLYEYLGETLDK